MAFQLPDLDNTINILIVEDDPQVATLIEEILAEASMRVAGTAASAIEALSIAQEQAISLALVDIGLIGSIDGIELACVLRDQHHVPVVFLSGAVDNKTMRRAQSATPLAFIAKPFRPSVVFNTIERALIDEPNF